MMRSVERSGVVVIAIVAVLALAAVLRVVDLGHEPFWLDEIMSHDRTSGTVREPKRSPAYRIGTRIEPGAPNAERSLW